MKNVTVTFNWRLDKCEEARSATIELDLSALSESDLLEYAYSDIIVQAQGKMRAWMKTDRSKTAPWVDGGKYVVKPKGTKVLADSDKIKAGILKQLGKLSPADIATLLAQMNPTV